LDYEHFVIMTNTALAEAWGKVQQQVLALTGTTPLSQCPYLSFNPSSKTFTLYCDAWCCASTSSTGVSNSTVSLSAGRVTPLLEERLQVGLNEMLQNLLMLPASVTTSYGSTLNFSTAKLTQTGRRAATPAGWAACSNDFSPTASLWSPIGSLVFLTAHWPVRTEISTTPTQYGADDFGVARTTTSTTYDSLQVLSDVVPNITDASDWRAQTTLYSPTVLRWIDFPASGFSIDTIDFRIGWRNGVTGRVVPLTMNPLARFSVKIQLRRKGAEY
jgi:hypothetical protein